MPIIFAFGSNTCNSIKDRNLPMTEDIGQVFSNLKETGKFFANWQISAFDPNIRKTVIFDEILVPVQATKMQNPNLFQMMFLDETLLQASKVRSLNRNLRKNIKQLLIEWYIENRVLKCTKGSYLNHLVGKTLYISYVQIAEQIG